jgi:hypothetical protein
MLSLHVRQLADVHTKANIIYLAIDIISSMTSNSIKTPCKLARQSAIIIYLKNSNSKSADVYAKATINFITIDMIQ